MSNKDHHTNHKLDQNSIETQRRLLDTYRHSLKLLALQASSFKEEVDEQKALIERIRSSLSWRLTLPVRILGYIVKGKLFQKYPLKIVKKRFIEIYKVDGYQGVYDKLTLRFPVIDRISQRILFANKQTKNSKGPQKDIFLDKLDIIYDYQFAKNIVDSDSLLILIIAEVTLPQCYKYRVQQKAEHLERLGWVVKIVDWREQKTALSLLQICRDVIFYRVPAFPNVVEQIIEAKRLGLSPWWEVDDLIVDKERYAECGFMEELSVEEKDLLFFGADLFRKTMLSCDRAIASTTALAEVMQQAGLSVVHVIENALDRDTLRIAERLNLSKKNNDFPIQRKTGEIVIVYGSGTNTHNADFLIVSQGILQALKQEPMLRLWIVGELDLSLEFQAVIHQIRYIPPQSYERYLEILSEADIAIAPLEAILFNDAKSNIKYLEASILKIASVCSPRQAFRETIQDYQNGLLADTTEAWTEKLLLLARDAELRTSIGQQAYENVTAYYAPESITTRQVKPVFGQPEQDVIVSKKLKILVVNIYYDPYSFGGATFVAEEMARRLHQKEDVEVTIFTSRPVKDTQRGLCKYERHGSIIYSVDLAPQVHAAQKFDNIEVIEPFEMVLDTVKPDVVHFHAIQNMGLQMLFACQSKQIPYVITLHDSWWLCNRQFMVRSNGKYCFQNKIDLKICQGCEPQERYLTERMIMMQQGLQGASLLLSPSETHRQLYIMNDANPLQIKVNRNGIMRPKKTRPMRPENTPIRFGFVAGDEVIKGALLIQNTFKSLSRSDWELKIIDSKVHMGYEPINVQSWKAKGKIVTIPPYDDEGKDDFFYGIDVLLFPSQWKESYGMTVREALLRDVWVICSHPGGQSEDVVDGVNGNYISLTGDQVELQNVIEKLLDNASLFDHYKNPHKEHIATLEEQADELLGYYRQVSEAVE
ncbi:hypothetical protein HK18_03390 [Commensalibacter intestini]|uniref:Glycosyl transferase n=1 Tax=Commensalibacter intestini TaxID=479936 RepID=A0A251ZSR6_9PROT|nr:glycosyltransferase [Commensalibacter intestini]OUI77703.1 hypothetical protein HK18_03390 [Commensalibacter intestini]